MWQRAEAGDVLRQQCSGTAHPAGRRCRGEAADGAEAERDGLAGGAGGGRLRLGHQRCYTPGISTITYLFSYLDITLDLLFVVHIAS